MTYSDTSRQAGHRLRVLRTERQWTLRDAEKKTEELYGTDNGVNYQQISRIEKGSLDRPPIIDLIRLGGIYGLTPDDIGVLYDLWQRSGRAKGVDRRISEAISASETLPAAVVEEMLNWIEFAVLQARAKAREAASSR